MKRNNLVIRTAYTFFSSLLKVDDIINYSVENNLDYASIVDKNVMYGAYELYKKAKANNLKPIIGLQVEANGINEVYIAKNYEGYKELMRVSSLIMQSSEFKVNEEDLIKLDRKLPIITHLKNSDSKALEMFAKVGKKPEAYQEGTHMNSESEDEEYISSIISEVNIEIPELYNKLPVYNHGTSVSNEEYFQNLLKDNLKKYLSNNEVDDQSIYLERMTYEYSVIKDMGFIDYFLIVWDIVKWSKENNIKVGPGRGSAAGSLISFLLNITTIDPIKTGLLFERFLNPERISMPDIDIDFADTRREDVIKYINERYGSDKVAQIITFQTLRAKMSFKDVAREFGMPATRQNEITKVLSDGDSLEEAYSKNKRFKNVIDSDEMARDIFGMAKLIEGLPRQFSTHAAGIVISDKPIHESVPVQSMHDGQIQTQYSMNYMEVNGLLKIDILGLRNLSFIDEAIELIGEDVKLDQLDLNDKRVYKLLSLGKTSGIFQLESNGMTAVLKQMKPERFEDIVATTSLFRPGPQKMIPTYIARKNGQEDIEYIDDVLEATLSDTYGIIVYQEQIMKIAQEFAGLSLAEADILRRAIGKKDVKALNELEKEFIDRSISNGRDDKSSKAIYDLIYEFAEYGFNRSHAYAYSVISYQLAYLKVNYPLQFMSSLLTSVTGSSDKTASYIDESISLGFKLLNPSINIATGKYEIVNNSIMISIPAIKGVGPSVVREIIAERENGEFKDFTDFILRIQDRKVSRAAIELLIKAGSFDEFGFNRETLLENIDVVLNYAQLIKTPEGYDRDLLPEPNISESKQTKEDSDFEIEVLGFNIAESPLVKYQDIFKQLGVSEIKDINFINGETIRVAGELKAVRKLKTKTGQEMAFSNIADLSSEASLTFWPATYAKYSELLNKGKIVLIEGKIDTKRQPTIIVSNVKEVE